MDSTRAYLKKRTPSPLKRTGGREDSRFLRGNHEKRIRAGGNPAGTHWGALRGQAERVVLFVRELGSLLKKNERLIELLLEQFPRKIAVFEPAQDFLRISLVLASQPNERFPKFPV